MAAVYTKRLAMGTQVAGTTTVVYTCPVGRVVVLRDINVVTGAGGANAVYFYINGVVYFKTFQNVPAVGSGQWQGRVVLTAGDTLTVTAVLTTFTYVVCGYEFSL